ncbi:hypothetical protein Hanom_Chr03g00206951 [Helianthus anomalus]
MNSLQQQKKKKKAFICEKEIQEVDFGPFGITDKFRALGWEAALKCYDNEVKTMYDQQVQEWMDTLECPPFKAPSKMKLVRTCNGVKVEMSYDSLRRIAKFDSQPSNQDIYPSLKDLYHEPEKHPQLQHMLDYLFLPGTTHEKLFRRNLRIEAKLMLVFCTHNVVPRWGDKMEVRFQEVPILYMLMHGSPMVPFRFLVLNNIWLSRNSGERKIVPHCRLITTLLKKYGVIGADDKGSYKRRRWRALKVDARPLRPGDAAEPETSDEEVSGDDNYREDTFTVDVPMGGAGPSGSVHGAGVQSGYVGSEFDYAQQPYSLYWAHTGNMGHIIEQRRPPTFSDWTEPNQMLFD